MKRSGVALASVSLLFSFLFIACEERAEPVPEAPEPAARAAEKAPAAPEPAAPAAAAPSPGPAAPTPAAAAAPDGGAVAPGEARELGPFEPTGEPLPLAGLAMPAEGARPYVPLGLPWPTVSALLDATPGLRVREHVGFYPPRPIDITGRPAPYTFGHVNALSRPGTWKPAPDVTFVLVPYHHTAPSLAFYAPAGEGTVRLVTKVEPVTCEEADQEIGFLVTRRGDNVQVLRTCGAQAEVTTYRAEGGRLAARVQSVDPAAVRVAGEEPAAP